METKGEPTRGLITGKDKHPSLDSAPGQGESTQDSVGQNSSLTEFLLKYKSP